MTKKVCKSTQGSDIHGGYSEHAKEIAGPPSSGQFGFDLHPTEPGAIQTYDFDGIEEVEFAEFHSPSPLLPDYARQLGDEAGFEPKKKHA